MNYDEYMEMGLNSEHPLKVILKASIENMEENNKVGVVSVVFVTTNKEAAKNKINELNNHKKNENDYYMVYGVPLDTDLETIGHYPSIAVFKEDLA